MSRLVAVMLRSLCLSFGLAGLAVAQEPPPLEPPSLEPPRTGATPDQQTRSSPKPVAPAQPTVVRPAVPRREVRPMLAIPGVTAPAAHPSTAYRPLVTAPAQRATSPAYPSLDALPLPSEFPTSRPLSRSSSLPLADPPSPPALEAMPPRPDSSAPRRPSDAVRATRPGPVADSLPGDTIPLTIEPIDERPSSVPDAAGRRAASRSMDGRSPDDRSRSRPDDAPTNPRPAPPRRGGGVLGRLFGPPPAPIPPSRKASRTDSKALAENEKESGLNADAIARRRIERQIRATLGDKVRSFEVHITGRNVVVVAQPSRFWLRRSVRRSLETLPALQGYRASIEIRD